jgi:hypothetical protein
MNKILSLSGGSSPKTEIKSKLPDALSQIVNRALVELSYPYEYSSSEDEADTAISVIPAHFRRQRTDSQSEKDLSRKVTLGSGETKIVTHCTLPQIPETSKLDENNPVVVSTLEWVSSNKLFEGKSLEKFKAAEFWKLVEAYEGLNEHELKIVYKFIAWLFFHDEERDRGDTTIGKSKEKIEALNAILMPIIGRKTKTEKTTLPDKSLSAIESIKTDGILDEIELRFATKAAIALDAIYTDLESVLLDLKDIEETQMPREHRKRLYLIEQFSCGISSYLSANVTEADHRSRDIIPNMNDYQLLRQSTGAVLPCFELGLALYQIALTKGLRDNAHFQDMRTRSNLVVSFVNDPFSFLRELLAGDPHNHTIVNIAFKAKPNGSDAKLIDVYAYIIKNGMAAVIEEISTTFSTVSGMVTKFSTALSDLQSHYQKNPKALEKITKCADFFKRWMVKNFDFSEASGRYKADFDSLIDDLKEKLPLLIKESISLTLTLCVGVQADPSATDNWTEIRRNILSITNAVKVSHPDLNHQDLESLSKTVDTLKTCLEDPQQLTELITKITTTLNTTFAQLNYPQPKQ